MGNYGYGWWLVTDGVSYLANGKDRQYLYMNPQQNTAILRLGWGTGDLFLSEWLDLFETLAKDGVSPG